MSIFVPLACLPDRKTFQKTVKAEVIGTVGDDNRAVSRGVFANNEVGAGLSRTALTAGKCQHSGQQYVT